MIKNQKISTCLHLLFIFMGMRFWNNTSLVCASDIDIVKMYIEKNDLTALNMHLQNSQGSYRSISLEKKNIVTETLKECEKKRKKATTWQSPRRIALALTGAGFFTLGIAKLVFADSQVSSDDYTHGGFNIVQDLGSLFLGGYEIMQAWKNEAPQVQYATFLNIQTMVTNFFNEQSSNAQDIL